MCSQWLQCSWAGGGPCSLIASNDNHISYATAICLLSGGKSPGPMRWRGSSCECLCWACADVRQQSESASKQREQAVFSCLLQCAQIAAQINDRHIRGYSETTCPPLPLEDRRIRPASCTSFGSSRRDLVAPSCPQLGVGFGPFDPPGTPRGPLQASHFAQFFSKGVPTGRAQSIRTHFATPRHALVRLPRPPNQGGGLGIAALGPLFIEQKFSRVTDRARIAEHGFVAAQYLPRSSSSSSPPSS
jgi:hypothetical protein